MKENDPFGSKEKKRQYWQGHTESWQRSGLSQADYCRRNALGIKKFGYWQRKHAREEFKPVAFYPLVPAKTSKPFRAAPASLLLILREKRFSIEVGETFSPTALRDLIVTLEEL